MYPNPLVEAAELITKGQAKGSTLCMLSAIAITLLDIANSLHRLDANVPPPPYEMPTQPCP